MAVLYLVAWQDTEQPSKHLNPILVEVCQAVRCLYQRISTRSSDTYLNLRDFLRNNHLRTFYVVIVPMLHGTVMARLNLCNDLLLNRSSSRSNLAQNSYKLTFSRNPSLAVPIVYSLNANSTIV